MQAGVFGLPRGELDALAGAVGEARHFGGIWRSGGVIGFVMVMGGAWSMGLMGAVAVAVGSGPVEER